MNINDFAVLISRKEKGKKEVSIAQIKEIISAIRLFLLKNTGLDIYQLIRKIKTR